VQSQVSTLFTKPSKEFLAFLKEKFHYDATKEYVCGPGDLGITNQQIALLKQHGIKHVVVKEGIPFVPSFLIAYVALWFVLPLLP